jgi:peptidoglycan/xylan/chitin deacetylase (PgdA/CDA1 family)
MAISTPAVPRVSAAVHPGSDMLRVVTYHRVAVPGLDAELNPRLVSATPDEFARQMAHLAQNYNVVSIHDVLNYVLAGARLPSRAVLITFDDGYRDFAENAFPVLKWYRLPVTLFIPTAFPGERRAFWWDRLHAALMQASLPKLQCALGAVPLGTLQERHQALRRLQVYIKSVPHQIAMQFVEEICAMLDAPALATPAVLDWDELRGLAKQGVVLGAHTRTHPILTQVPVEQVNDEIAGAQQDLRRQIGSVLPVFCYPAGACNHTVASALRRAHITIAFTTLDGHNFLRSADPLRLRRTNITRRTTMPIFRFRMMRFAAYVDRWRHRGTA